MSLNQHDQGSVGHATSTDPLDTHVLSAHLATGFLLTLATLAFMFGKPTFGIVGLVLNLPVSAYACVFQARRMGVSPWLAAICFPFSPWATWLLKRLASRRTSPSPTSADPAGSQQAAAEPDRH